MVEATRLTREGKLTEATAMLQGLCSGKGHPPAETPAPVDAAKPAERTPGARLFEVEAETGTARQAAEPARFLAGTFGNEAGSRPYKHYVPAHRPAGPRGPWW